MQQQHYLPPPAMKGPPLRSRTTVLQSGAPPPLQLQMGLNGKSSATESGKLQVGPQVQRTSHSKMEVVSHAINERGEGKENRTSFEELRRGIQRMQEGEKLARRDVEIKESEMLRLRKTIEQQRRSLNELQRTAEGLSIQLEDSEKKSDEAKLRSETTLGACIEITGRIQETSRVLIDAKVDRDSLEKVNSNQRAELNGLVERFRELTFVTAKREGNLKTDLAVAREQVAQLNETVQAKEIELAALLASKQDVWNERNMLMETLGSLQAQLELTNDERATVALQLANATAGKQATDALLSSIRDRLQASTDECAGLRRDLLACRDTLLCKDTEINGFEQAIQAGHTRIADMRTASEDSQKLFSERLISIQRERDAFELKLTESVAAKAALQSDADEIAAALSASVDKLQALQASETCLRHEIEQAKRRAIAAELKSSEDLATATAEITALKLCAETMAAELLCDKAACKSLTSELESTKVEVNRLRNELADALASGAKAECNARAVGREAAARQEETQQRIADLEQQLATIAPILASCQQDHTVARFEELSRLSKEETTLKAVISKLEGENLVLLGKIASLQTELQGRIHELQARLNGAVEAKHFADSALKNSKEECAALSVAVRDLRARLDIKVRELDLAQLPSARQLEITTTVTPSKAPATPSVTPIGTSTPLLKSGNEDYEGSRLSKKAKLRSPSTPPNPMDTTPSIRTARAPKPKRDTASARTPARKGPSGTATRGPRATAPKRDAWVDHDDVWGFDEC